MPFEVFLALRHLRFGPKRRLARVTSLIAIVGIAIGCAALIVALALANGFRDEMRDKILRGTAHITIMRRDGVQMTDWRALVNRIRETDGVADATPTTYDGALLSSTNGSSYAVLRGLDRDSTRALAEIRRNLIAGTIEPLLNEPSPFATNEHSPQAPTEDEKRAGRHQSPITPFDQI